MALGWPHPDYLLEYLTWQQFCDWADVYEVDPWGDQRADLRAGTITAMVHNCQLAKGGKAKNPADFMHFKDEVIQTAEEQQSAMRRFLGN